MIAIPNMEKPEYCRVCHERLKCKQYDGEILHTPDDCPLIEIDLVRCGECKWWDKDDKRKDGKGWCENVICGLTESNAFCSYGERRNE